MALRRKGSAPWSLTKDTGLSDAPVSGSPFVEGDEVKPIIDAGYIDGNGLWQLNASNDLAFTFQDPSQAMGAGAAIVIEGINMLNHDALIVAILDSSGIIPKSVGSSFAPGAPAPVRANRTALLILLH